MSVTETARKKRDQSFAYDIAFSFAEEDRGFVDKVAELLRAKNVKVYYDDHERIKTWGEDLRKHLHNIYLNEARFCMIFISEAYKRKYWTQFEQDRVKARSFFTEHKAYILPFKLDDTEIEGITDTLMYLSADKLNEAQLAEAILEKINSEKKTRLTLWQRCRNMFSGQFRAALITLGIVGGSVLGLSELQPSYQRIVTAPVQTLLRKISERKPWHFSAVCRDGWLSQSHGSGTCSWHRGVDHYVDTVVYGATIEQCQQEAMQAFKAADK